MKYYTLYPLLFFAGLFIGIYRCEILDWFLRQLVRFKIADYSEGLPDIKDIQTEEKCQFEDKNVCYALACYSSKKCKARDEKGSPVYAIRKNG